MTDPAAQHEHSLNPTGPSSWAPSFRPQPSTRQRLGLVFFSINNSRNARRLASICHLLPSLHCLLFPSLVSASWLVPGCLHHGNSRKQFDHLVFLPRPLPIRLSDTRTTSLRNHSICAITLITSLHDDRSRRGAAVHIAVSSNCGLESARRWKKLEHTTAAGHRQKTSSTSPCSQESTSAAFSWPDDK